MDMFGKSLALVSGISIAIGLIGLINVFGIMNLFTFIEPGVNYNVYDAGFIKTVGSADLSTSTVANFISSPSIKKPDGTYYTGSVEVTIKNAQAEVKYTFGTFGPTRTTWPAILPGQTEPFVKPVFLGIMDDRPLFIGAICYNVASNNRGCYVKFWMGSATIPQVCLPGSKGKVYTGTSGDCYKATITEICKTDGTGYRTESVCNQQTAPTPTGCTGTAPACPSGYTGSAYCSNGQWQLYSGLSTVGCQPPTTPQPIQCTGDSTCPPGTKGTMNCVSGTWDSSVCVSDIPQDPKCPPGYTGTPPDCVKEKTVCAAGCPDGKIQLPNCSCVDSTVECPEGSILKDGICVLFDNCVSDTDCGTGKECIKGNCFDVKCMIEDTWQNKTHTCVKIEDCAYKCEQKLEAYWEFWATILAMGLGILAIVFIRNGGKT